VEEIMVKIKLVAMLLSVSCLCLPFFVFAEKIKVDAPAPFFRAVSGDDAVLTLDDIKGKVAVIFYETKEAKEVNRLLKNELNIFYEKLTKAEKKNVIRIAVIDCRGVIFLGAWKLEFRENSRKEGIVVYGDWDGNMYSSYCIEENLNNFLIIDREGIVRYFRAGKVPASEIARIKDLLKKLMWSSGK
jgi:predicted transcriptional regulator